MTGLLVGEDRAGELQRRSDDEEGCIESSVKRWTGYRIDSDVLRNRMEWRGLSVCLSCVIWLGLCS